VTGREGFLNRYNVPRGTAAQFDRYAALLVEWQARMNLVSRSTLDQFWDRHVADSAQLVDFAPATPSTWLDIGAGAGFPGIVIALLTEHRVTLVEATTKKCHFLKTVVDELGLGNVNICNLRAEALHNDGFDVISARAFAPLTRLFELGSQSARESTRWLLLKGGNVQQELDEARLAFDFSAELMPSRTDPRGRIVVAAKVRRKAVRR